MSIRLLALELYRCQKQVDQLKKALNAAPPDKRAAIEAQLRVAQSEQDTMRRALDGRIGR
ncbi:MAG: hypothetical protein KFF50_13935 [Desulfatitalea sp.]|nr:hypothetical protein [Desulfatitalea sp.]